AVQATIGLGEQLGLPESPALVIERCHPGQKAVLVVDQLDFVSATSGRNPNFFDTVAALLVEIRGLRSTFCPHVIIACRKFDFENDHRLRKLLPPQQEPIDVGPWTEAEVKATISAAGGDVSRLSNRQFDLLRLPQNLSLFVDSGLASNPKPAFLSQKQLFDAYWEAKQRELIATHAEQMT